MPAANPVRAAVLGAGSFGTCLSMLLAERGFDVALWARNPEIANAINRYRRNPGYLSEFSLPEGIHATASLEDAVAGRELLLSVVPSHGVREVWSRAARHVEPRALVISATKGIEVGSGKLMSEVLREELPAAVHERLVVLSGPSFAHEIALRRPTAVALACRNETYAIAAQTMISSPVLRCYSNPDVVGVELAGALKNVVAIAVGVVDGLGLGLNSRAALITRGLAEITRLGLHLGADRATFQGLAGMGDLVLTCTGDLSRNRQLGLRIARGERVDEVVASTHQVAEGLRTTRSAYELAQKHGVEMPITEAAYQLLYDGKPLEVVMRELTARQLRSELD
jgi:glycerol-3-phosphate dehydrogenase (NAD(P)+)